MESTGVYWKPILNVLEDDGPYSLKVLLANPQQVKAVTGHKTDPHDARWLAHLLRHGMIRPSFIPPRAIRELRDFTRRRKQMIGLAAPPWRNKGWKIRQRKQGPDTHPPTPQGVARRDEETAQKVK